MAAGPITLISDLVVPEIFSGYIQQLTETKSRLIQSGALARDAFIDSLLGGAGLTFNIPSAKDLDDDADRVSTDTSVDDFAGGTARPVPKKIGTATEIATRLSRNQSWSTSDLAETLAGEDMAGKIANRVSDYWVRRLQDIVIATCNGVIADNTANDAADYTNDVSGAGFVAGVTDFSTGAFIDTTLTMGDSMGDTGILMVHSIVYSRMQKNNLIDFIPDAEGRVVIPTYLGRQVVVDDGLPVTGSVHDSWLFGAGALRLGVGSPAVGTEVEREAGGGNGGGQEILYSRQEWCVHPVGHAFAGTAPNGGPSNTGTGGDDLDEAGSWNRVYTDRKQIKFARLVTREA